MRVIRYSMILGLCTACVQELPAPVEYQGGRVFGKEGQYAQNGSELPKYSADNPAELPEWQADKYSVPDEKSQYNVAAEYDAVSSSELAPPTANTEGESSVFETAELEEPKMTTPPPLEVEPKPISLDNNEQEAAPVEFAKPEEPIISAPKEVASDITEQEERDLINPQKSGFIWPVRGEIVQAYNKDNRGINIAARKGTPIRAVNDGVVQYAGNKIKGYGNLVIVAHRNGYYSAYAHADDIVVAKGASIVQGQLIGFVGSTGAVDKSQLYFSLRNGTEENSSVNPIPLLEDD